MISRDKIRHHYADKMVIIEFDTMSFFGLFVDQRGASIIAHFYKRIDNRYWLTNSQEYFHKDELTPARLCNDFRLNVPNGLEIYNKLVVHFNREDIKSIMRLKLV